MYYAETALWAVNARKNHNRKLADEWCIALLFGRKYWWAPYTS
jgi:hypothetical protein